MRLTCISLLIIYFNLISIFCLFIRSTRGVSYLPPAENGFTTMLSVSNSITIQKVRNKKILKPQTSTNFLNYYNNPFLLIFIVENRV